MRSETTRIVRASIIGSVAVLPILILPTMVGALVDHAGFSETAAGWAAAVGFAGSALGAMVAGLRIQHLDPRKLAVFGLTTLALFDAAAIFVLHIPVWLFVTFRFLSGIGGTVAYAAVMAHIAATNNPERGYGVFMGFQFGISAIGLYALPLILPFTGVAGMYFCLAAAAAFSLLLRKSVMHREVVVEDAAIEIHMLIRPAAMFAMFGVGCYETANFIYFTYAERIGVSFGFPNHQIGQILGFASLLGIPAALIVIWLGDRFGQLRPLAFAVMLAIGALAWLLVPVGPVTYMFSMGTLGFAWAFGLPYFYAFEARLDPGGSVVVVGGFFTACGTFIGPAVAAGLVKSGGYGSALLGAIGTYALTLCFVALSAHFASRRPGTISDS